jgi:hypothetical protein
MFSEKQNKIGRYARCLNSIFTKVVSNKRTGQHNFNEEIK